MKRKILSFILTLCMIMSALPLTVIDASAVITESGSCGYGITYSIYDNGDLVIRGTGAAGDYGSSFAENKNILNVKIDEGVTALGDLLFENCTNIKSVYFPASLVNISGSTFFGCTGLENISISKENKVLSFSNGILTSENGTKIIAILPMAQTNVFTVSEGIKTIASYAFKDNTVMSEINLPSTLETIEANAFSGCIALEKINIAPSSALKNIGENVIEDTIYYKNYPGNIIYVGDILYRCKSEAGSVIDVKEGTKFINYNAFEGCSITSINLPASLIKADRLNFSYIYNLTEINVNPENKNLSSADGVLYNGDKTELIYIPRKYKNTVLNLPDGLITVKDYAALNNDTVEEINIPDSVKEIGKCSFYAYALKKVNISKESKLEFIGDEAFAGGFKTIIIPSGVKKIGYKAFYNVSLERAYVYAMSISNIGDCTFPGSTIIAGYHGSTLESFQYTFIAMCKPNLVYQEAKAPTCSEYGYSAHYKCSYCGKLYTDTVNMNEVLLSELRTEKLPHTAEYVPEKAPTCAEEGYKAHYKCTVCGALCSDAEGKNEITAEDIKISKHEHTFETIPAKESTCIEKGNNLYYRCTECNNYYKKLSDSVKDAFKFSSWFCASHDLAINNSDIFISEGELNSGFTKGTELNLKREGDTVTAEIYVKGLSGYVLDSAIINYPASVLEVISVQPDNYDINTDTSVPGKVYFSGEYSFVTASSDLYHLGTVKFRVTGDIIKTTPEAELRDFAEHTKGEEFIKENEVLPTCTSTGHYDKVYICTVCGAAAGRETVNTDMLPHTIEPMPEKAPTCAEEGYKAHYKCSVCGALFSDAEGKTEINAEDIKISKHEHIFETIPAKESTCIEKGNNLYYRCSVCNNYYKKLSDSVKDAFKFSSWCHAGAYYTNNDTFISEGELNSGFTEGTELNLKREGDTVTAEIYVKGLSGYVLGNAIINYPASVLEVISAQGVNTDTSVPGKVEFSRDYYDSSISSSLYHVGTVKFRVTGDIIKTTPEEEIRDFAEHTKGEEFIKENEVLPTCTSTGYYTKAYICTVCGAVAAREAVETDMLPHTAEFMPEKAPTCAIEGYKEHYKCIFCGKLFSDKDCTAEITADDIKLSATEHKLEPIPAILPTCTKKGNNLYYQCTLCKNYFNKTSDKPSNAFNGMQISDNELNPGIKSGYEVLLKLTGDIITADFYIKNEKGHKFYGTTLNYNENAVEFTGSEYTFGGIRCDNSETGRIALTYGDSSWSDPLPIETDLLHFATLKFRITGNLIETTAGNEEYFYKDYKGDIDFDGEITALDARLILRAAVALEEIPEERRAIADMDSDRKITAADARLVLRAAVGLEKLPDPEAPVHTPGKAVKENEKAASCKTSGYYDEVTYCEKCNKELSRERIYIPATGENHQLEKIPAKSPTCSNPGNNEYFYCRTCDKYFKLTEEISAGDFGVSSLCYFNDGSVISDNRVSADSADSSFIKGTELILSGNTLTVNLKNCRGLIADELTIYFNPDIISKSIIGFGTDLKELMEWGSQNRYSSEKNCGNNPGIIKIAGYFDFSLGEFWTDEDIPVNTDFFNTDKIMFTVLPHYAETTPEKELIRETGDHVKSEKTENEIPSTCIKEGSREIVTYCTECGEEFSRVKETLPLADHTPGEKLIENKVYPTATTDGSYDIVCYCSVCGKELSREKYLLPGFKVHEFGEWTVTTQASCTSTGLKTRKCLNCNAEETEIIPMLPHVKGKGVMENKVAPTFTEDGSYDVVFYCTVCGKEVERVTFPVPAKNHFWTGWEVTEAPTCTEAGIKTRKCIECGQVETAFIEKCPHTEEISPSLPPTCVSVGYTEGVKCAVCGEILSAPKEIPMIPHADADNDGYCDMCGTKLSEEKPDCKCICHSESKFVRFFYKIACFFWKLFKINQFCECGAQHW